MNTLTYHQKAPMGWPPLLCLLEGTTRPQSRDPTSGELKRLLHQVVDSTTMGSLMARAGGSGKTALHMARCEWMVRVMLDRIVHSACDPSLIVNITDERSHAPVDLHWNNRAIKNHLAERGGKEVKPMPAKANAWAGGWVNPSHAWHRSKR